MSKRKAVARSTKKAPARRRMQGKPRRRSSRRRAMRGMSMKSATDTVLTMVQGGLGMLGYGLAAPMARKAFPNANQHVLNLGAVALGTIVAETMPQAKKVAIGFGSAAVANSAIQFLPADMMNGSHTRRVRDLRPEERRAIEQKARAGMDRSLNGRRDNGMDVLNGALNGALNGRALADLG